MAESNVKITFEIDGLEQSVSSIDEAKQALAGLESQAKKSEKTLDDAADAAKDFGDKSVEAGEAGEGAMKVLDEATGGLASKIRDVGGGLKSMGKFAVNAFKGAVQGASAMRKALIATGIGALVVGLGLVVAYWDDIKAAVFGANEESEKFLEIQGSIEETTKKATVQLAQETSELERLVTQIKNTASGTKERELALKDLNDTYGTTLQNEQDETQFLKNLDEQQKIIIANIENKIKVMELEQKMSIATEELVRAEMEQQELRNKMQEAWGQNAFTEFLQGFGDYENTKGVLADQFAANEKIIEMLRATKETAISELTGINVERGKMDAAAAEAIQKEEERISRSERAAEKRKAQREKEAADRLRLEQDAQRDLEALRKENEDLIIKAEEDEDVRALAQLEVRQERELEALRKKYGENTELEKQLIINQALEMDALISKIEETNRQKEVEKARENRQIIDDLLAQANLDRIEDQFELARQELQIQQDLDLAKLEAAGATEAEINRIKASYVKKNKDLDQEEADFKESLRKADVDAALQAGSDVLGSIVDLVGEGSAIGKAAAVAQTTIDTYKSATAAYSSVVGIPIVGPALAPIAAGVAVASGVMSVKKILSTKTPGNKSAGGGAPAVNIPSAPAFDPTAALGEAQGTQTGENQITLGEQQGSTGGTVVKAYVVSSDMTSQQEADAKINALARL